VYDFIYHNPETLDAALGILAAEPEAQALAGGMTLVPTMRQRLANPGHLVDLGAISGLRHIREDEDGHLSIGAMTPHAAVAASSLVRARIPALAELANMIGDPQVRNRGTIGGSIANSDPAADYPAALVALGAQVRTDRRRMGADEFFRGLFETALESAELVTEVRFPAPRRAAYAKFANPASRYAIVGVFVAESADGVRVTVTGAGPSVFRVAEMEQALAADFTEGALDGMQISFPDLNEDMHASPDYRAHLVGVMARRAVKAARERRAS
jgi:carbon-monoxide dehydrogenase medium subunit